MRASGANRWTRSTRTAVSFCQEAASAIRSAPNRSTTSWTTSSGLDELKALTPPGGLRAGREVAERLAVAVVLLVEVEDAQQGLVEVPVRDLAHHDVAEVRVGTEPAADADV